MFSNLQLNSLLQFPVGWSLLRDFSMHSSDFNTCKMVCYVINQVWNNRCEVQRILHFAAVKQGRRALWCVQRWHIELINYVRQGGYASTRLCLLARLPVCLTVRELKEKLPGPLFHQNRSGAVSWSMEEHITVCVRFLLTHQRLPCLWHFYAYCQRLYVFGLCLILVNVMYLRNTFREFLKFWLKCAIRLKQNLIRGTSGQMSRPSWVIHTLMRTTYHTDG